VTTKPPADGEGDDRVPHSADPRPDRQGGDEPREAELISFPRGVARGGRVTEHLTANRSLVVRRSLLATAVGGVVPIPVMDDYLAGRVRAGRLMKIADRRKVDLVPSAAELLADPREGTAARNATMTAATLLALKLAWRKFFIVLGAGRRAEEMATTFQMGTLFDHFCAKSHVGAGLDRTAAIQIRTATFASIRGAERGALVGIFREGAEVLGRSIGEAPGWVSRQLQRAVEHYVASGGNPDAVPVDLPRDRSGRTHDRNAASPKDATHAAEADAIDPDARWLDRAAAVIEDRLGRLGTGYLESLLSRFDDHLAAPQPAPRPGGTK
jgi:hypothetical protein